MSQKLKILARLRLYLLSALIALAWVSASFTNSMAGLYETTARALDLGMTPARVEAALGAAARTGESGGRDLLNADALQRFYGQRDNTPYWFETTRLKDKAHILIEALEASWTHGLNPARYHIDKIQAFKNVTDPQRQRTLELLLTDALVRYVQDLSGMRVNPDELRLDHKSWRRAVPASGILQKLDDQTLLKDFLASYEPKSHTYAVLREELIRLSEAPPAPYEALLPIEPGGILKPGWGHESIVAIRARLGVEPQTANEYLYDDRLAAAVMKFQKEHGQEPDGLIGAATLHFLNQTRETKIRQIVANLERLRWMPESKPERYVVVNVPAARLWAIDNGKVELEMPVIVGHPARRTKSFITEVTGVRFNPDWTIPPTIKRFDILPKIREDVNYLQDKGIEVIRGYGSRAVTLDPLALDWNNMSWRALNGLRMVQMPGEHNPLGRIRILMPNRYNIYLHDTNHPEYFDSSVRAVSSGCIRMKEPEKMAAFILKGHKDGRQSRIRALLGTGKTTDIETGNTIPVYILYYTVWVDERGQVVYGHDLYGHDRRLISKLADIDGVYIPGHNEPGRTDRAVLAGLQITD